MGSLFALPSKSAPFAQPIPASMRSSSSNSNNNQDQNDEMEAGKTSPVAASHRDEAASSSPEQLRVRSPASLQAVAASAAHVNGKVEDDDEEDNDRISHQPWSWTQDKDNVESDNVEDREEDKSASPPKGVLTENVVAT